MILIYFRAWQQLRFWSAINIVHNPVQPTSDDTANIEQVPPGFINCLYDL